MERIAVVGSGIAGLSAAWMLSRDRHVTLFEAGDYLGGHSHTVDVTLDGVTAPVDTAFLVHNRRTYPNLIALFDELGVATTDSDMSFSVRLEDPRLEWAGTNLASVFAQARNLARPDFWRMLRDILRFNGESEYLLGLARTHGLSVGELLERCGYSEPFARWYLLPMAAAIWSSSKAGILDFPAETFLRFCRNHGLLQLRDRPQWRTVVGGSREYVRRLAAAIPDIRMGAAVRRIERRGDGVRVCTDNTDEHFDEVVLGCHTDQSLAMLADASTEERRVLGAIRYQANRAVLHTDARFLPSRRRTWAAWNYHAGAHQAADRPVAVTYLLNKLQPLPFGRPLLLTLNPYIEPAADTVIDRYVYDHPVFDAGALHAQSRLGEIQGRRDTWFCGAWAGYGFHEDGLRSAQNVVRAMGTEQAWLPVEAA